MSLPRELYRAKPIAWDAIRFDEPIVESVTVEDSYFRGVRMDFSVMMDARFIGQRRRELELNYKVNDIAHQYPAIHHIVIELVDRNQGLRVENRILREQLMEARKDASRASTLQAIVDRLTKWAGRGKR